MKKKKTEKADACATCLFWWKDSDKKEFSHPTGRCKRFPPQVSYDAVSDRVETHSPKTCDVDWCGEWKKGDEA